MSELQTVISIDNKHNSSANWDGSIHLNVKVVSAHINPLLLSWGMDTSIQLVLHTETKESSSWSLFSHQHYPFHLQSFPPLKNNCRTIVWNSRGGIWFLLRLLLGKLCWKLDIVHRCDLGFSKDGWPWLTVLLVLFLTQRLDFSSALCMNRSYRWHLENTSMLKRIVPIV